MSENKRRKQHTDLECVQTGFANGVAPNFPLSEEDKWDMVDRAEKAYGEFLTALVWIGKTIQIQWKPRAV
jgi:hypothetical protein